MKPKNEILLLREVLDDACSDVRIDTAGYTTFQLVEGLPILRVSEVNFLRDLGEGDISQGLEVFIEFCLSKFFNYDKGSMGRFRVKRELLTTLGYEKSEELCHPKAHSWEIETRKSWVQEVISRYLRSKGLMICSACKGEGSIRAQGTFRCEACKGKGAIKENK